MATRNPSPSRKSTLNIAWPGCYLSASTGQPSSTSIGRAVAPRPSSATRRSSSIAREQHGNFRYFWRVSTGTDQLLIGPPHSGGAGRLALAIAEWRLLE
jgi:hypothetical protein